MLSTSALILNYICPGLGVIFSGIMFSAPIHDLKEAILKGSLGGLNPIPWALQTGNCLGWCVYAYCTHDAFVLASNLPGFLVSLWLNMGAVKLQFLQQHQDECSSKFAPVLNEFSVDSTERSGKVVLPQETLLLWVLTGWSWILIWVGWISPKTTATVIGIFVNINLIFFFGAPLQALAQVVRSKSSDCIHIPSMSMTIINTLFWLSYGVARSDPVIYVPNSLGLFLGICQGILCIIYPSEPPETGDSPSEGTRLMSTSLVEAPPGGYRKHHRRYYSTGNVRVI